MRGALVEIMVGLTVVGLTAAGGLIVLDGQEPGPQQAAGADPATTGSSRGAWQAPGEAGNASLAGDTNASAAHPAPDASAPAHEAASRVEDASARRSGADPDAGDAGAAGATGPETAGDEGETGGQQDAGDEGGQQAGGDDEGSGLLPDDTETTNSNDDAVGDTADSVEETAAAADDTSSALDGPLGDAQAASEPEAPAGETLDAGAGTLDTTSQDSGLSL